MMSMLAIERWRIGQADRFTVDASTLGWQNDPYLYGHGFVVVHEDGTSSVVTHDSFWTQAETTQLG